METENNAGLNVSSYYTATIFEKSSGAKAFEKWFNTIFSVQHPDLSKEFDMYWEINQEDGKSYLHMICNSIFFTTQHLLILFVDDMNSSAN